MRNAMLGLALCFAGLTAVSAPVEIAPPVIEKTPPQAVKSRVRINRIVLFSENGSAGVIVMRERQQINADGAVVGVQRLPMIRRDLAVAPKEVVVGPNGERITLSEVIGLLDRFAAKWETEDEPTK